MTGEIFSPSYPTAYLRCLAYMHGWQIWRTLEKGRKLYEAVWCPSCTSERIRTYGYSNEVESERRTYPAGYSIPGYNLNDIRQDAKRELARRGVTDKDAPERDPIGWDSIQGNIKRRGR